MLLLQIGRFILGLVEQLPVMPSELPKNKFDLRSVAKYIKEHNISVATMTEKEILLKKI